MKTECSMCGGLIEVPDDCLKGELVSCPDCGTDYEVVGVGGGQVTLQAAEDVKEDWGGE